MNKSFQIWNPFVPILFPKDSKNQNLKIGPYEVEEKRRLNRVNKLKKSVKKTFFPAELWDQLWGKIVKSETTSFHYFFQGLWISKKFRHWTLWNGGKKTVKPSEKSVTDKQTDRQTDKHTDISTYRKNRPRGSILWRKMSAKKSKETCLAPTKKIGPKKKIGPLL